MTQLAPKERRPDSTGAGSEGRKATDRSTLRYLSRLAGDESARLGHRAPVPAGPQLVRDVMVTSVVSAHEGAVFKEIVGALLRNRISAVPVIDDERRVLGVVSEADLMIRIATTHPVPPRGHVLSRRADERRKLHAATAGDLMTSPACVISPTASIESAAWHAARSRVRLLPVIDDGGTLQGIVTRGDLLRIFLRPDDEILDDIIENVITGSFLLDPRAVQVTVDEGVVTLRGTAESAHVPSALIETVRGVSGVVDVDAAGLRCPDPSRAPRSA